MNIVKAIFSGGCTQITAAGTLWQWDQGQILQIVGLDLPDAYQVEFSNQPVRGAAAPMIGGVGGVEIPDVYLTTGRDIYAFVVLHSGETDRETEYRITIHVNARPQPTDVRPTPEQQGVIDQLIAALNVGVQRAEDAADQAEAAVTCYPKIVDGTWWVYDAETETWADTGIQAEGQDGVGISGAVLNADYTLTLTFSDGTSYTTPPIRGAQGERGPIGPTPDISIGTVTTGAAGSQAEATMTGTPEQPVLNLTIPRGDPGEVTQAEFDDLADEVAQQKSALDNTSQVVYKTEISSTTGLIPFHANTGDSITIRTKDGSNFIAADQIIFYDANRTMIKYWATVPTTANSRTFTYTQAEALYIGITQVASSVVDYIVINNSSNYNFEPMLANVQNEITQLQTKVENVEDDLYEQTVILTDNSQHPFPIANNTSIVITTEDGTTLPDGNPYLQFFDSDHTYLGQFLCSSAYGISRTVTVTFGDVAYVRMYAVPSKPIKVYVPDNNKLIVKVNEIANAVGQNTIVVDASGSGDYASFTKAIYETVDSGRNVYVKPGTYNIVSEYVALFGQSAVDSMADSDSAIFNGFQYGVRLRNRRIEFAPGAHLVCDWTGHTVDGTHRFCALRVDYDVEINGLDLDVTATLYCIHDDFGIATPYTVKYENCRVVGHNLINANCIGGGCKKYSRHILNNCYFDNNLTGSATVRYHNTNAEGAEPEIYVSDCYFNNWFTPRWYGAQTSKMRVYVNNCHARAIYKVAESSSYNVDNVELYKWNNEETDPRT